MKNPWMIIVDDDPTQEDDLFDYLSRNFNDIWTEAKEWPVKERQRTKDFDPKNVFISHGRNELVKLKIKDYIDIVEIFCILRVKFSLLAYLEIRGVRRGKMPQII